MLTPSSLGPTGQTTITEATQATIIVTVFLVLKYIVSNSRLGLLRAKAGLRLKEDAQNAEPTDADREAAERANRIVINVRLTARCTVAPPIA